MSNRNLRAQKIRIEDSLKEMELAYFVANGGKPGEHIQKVTKPYRGLVFYFVEPLLPGYENPVLIEEALGDSWTLRLEPMSSTLKKLIGA